MSTVTPHRLQDLLQIEEEYKKKKRQEDEEKKKN